jgi:Cu/Ag efflux protein CusF
MKAYRKLMLVAICFAVVSINLYSQQNDEGLPPKELWSQMTIQASIEAIDLASREVTLKGPQGNLVTVEVDNRVKRLSEFKVGDVVSAEYWTYLKAEFREPTPAERNNPLVVLAEGGRAPEGMPPSAAVGAVVKAVVVVDLINRTEGQVTIRGPRGKYMTFQVADQNVINQLKVRDEVILTYAEALALSLKKVLD